jgi:DNA modification methylase
MANLPLFETPKQIESRFSQDADLVVYHGDVNDFVATLPDNSIKLIITSPPYNLGKDYESRVAIESYLETQSEVITQLYRILREDGSICWQVGNFVQDGEVYPLDILYYGIFKRLSLFLRNRIVWHFAHGLHASKRFSGRYETILWFTKSDKYTFNLDSVRVPSKYPGKRHFKGPNIGKPSGNPLGKNPSDVWEVLAQEWEESLGHSQRQGQPPRKDNPSMSISSRVGRTMCSGIDERRRLGVRSICWSRHCAHCRDDAQPAGSRQ